MRAREKMRERVTVKAADFKKKSNLRGFNKNP